jgi:hypothetical protein
MKFLENEQARRARWARKDKNTDAFNATLYTAT